MANLYSKLADLIEKHPKRVILTWVVVLLLALPLGVMTMTQPGVLQYDMTAMVGDDSESVQGMYILADTNYFDSGSTGMDPIIVVEVPTNPANDTTIKNGISNFVDELNNSLSDEYDKGFVSIMDAGFYSKNSSGSGIEMIALTFTADVNVNKQIPAIRELVDDAKDASGMDYTTYVTGSSAINFDTEDGAMTDVKRIDPFSILLVLILIGLFFRSFVSAATPPCVIGFAYAMTLAVIYGLSQLMGIYYMTSTLVLIAMLGAGCDYCIFILSRYREERVAGKDHSEALREAIVWAGESITTSGISVIIGFGAMSLCSFAMIKTMGIVLAAGIVFALLAALTLIPAIIAVVGDKIFYPNKALKLDPKGKTMNSWYGAIVRFGHRYFRSSAEHATKYAVPIVIAALLITLPLGYVALNNTGSYDMISTMPESEAKAGVEVITENAYGGLVMPTYVLLQVDGDDELYDFEYQANGLPVPQMYWTSEGEKYSELSVMLMLDIWNSDKSLENMFLGKEGGNIAYTIGAVDSELLVNELSRLTGGVVTPDEILMLFATQFPEEISKNIVKLLGLKEQGLIDDTMVFGAVNYIFNTGLGTVSEFYEDVQYLKMNVVVKDEPMSNESMETIQNVREVVQKFMDDGGDDYFAASYVTGTVAVIDDMSESINKDFKIIEVLVIILIALLLFFVMKSYFTPIRSLVTIIMSVIWTLGLTFIVFENIIGVPVTFIMPIILFVICLGLGMDYDILLTTRIRENVTKGMSNDKAIKEAIVKSGSIITICGIIMASAFGTMMLSTSPMLQEVGFALCFAIAVDALVIRTYVVPALMHLMGKWNWVGPKWLSRDGQHLTDLLAEAKDDGSLDEIDDYLACDTGYRFCTHFRTGMFMLVAVIAMALAVFIPWIAMGKPAFETLSFIDLINASGNAGTAATLAMVAAALFLLLAGICATNRMSGTTKFSGLFMVAGAFGVVAAIFASTSLVWGIALALLGLSCVAMFNVEKGSKNAVQSGIAAATLIAMVGVYFNDVFYVTMGLAFVVIVALLVTSLMHIMRD